MIIKIIIAMEVYCMDSQVTRSAEWGHWGITFIQWTGARRPYLPQIMGNVYFPVGSCGPCDGFAGSTERNKWRDMIQKWANDAILPENIDTKFACKQSEY